MRPVCHLIACSVPVLAAPVLHAILAGGESDLPADTPSLRLDSSGEFAFVGAVSISNGVQSFIGPGVELSSEWLLTAGHNADLNDDGVADADWSGTFDLPGAGSFDIAYAVVNPWVSGFANPSLNDDLALFRLTDSLPASM